MGPADAAWKSLEGSRRDWRIWFGLTITVGWLAFGTQYILGVVGWERFASLPADGMGGFLEGAFAPLAFLWLVIGFFLQQRELTQNTEAIRMQYDILRKSAEQAEVQARAITLNEMHQHRETFLKVVDIVFNQMGVIAGFLYMSIQATEARGGVTTDIGDLWTRLGAGDPEVFSRQLMATYFSEGPGPETAHELFWSTEVRARHSTNFNQTFERLLRNAEACDVDRTIRDALEGSANGIIYHLIQESREVGA
jgi:hypothetical protein